MLMSKPRRARSERTPVSKRGVRRSPIGPIPLQRALCGTEFTEGNSVNSVPPPAFLCGENVLVVPSCHSGVSWAVNGSSGRDQNGSGFRFLYLLKNLKPDPFSSHAAEESGEYHRLSPDEWRNVIRQLGELLGVRWRRPNSDATAPRLCLSRRLLRSHHRRG